MHDQEYLTQVILRSALYQGLLPLCLFLLAAFFANRVHDRLHEPRGCRKIGLRTRSNLADEYEEVYAETNGNGSNGSWRVKSLWIYPVKSCTGVELDQSMVTGSGMQYDRRFCFAQLSSKFPAGLKDSEKAKAEHRWKFITQRTFAAMARIKTEIWLPDPASSTYLKEHTNVESGGVLVLKFPSIARGNRLRKTLHYVLSCLGMESDSIVHIPFKPSSEQITRYGYTIESMEIWKDSPTSLLIASSEDGDPWTQDLRYYLGISNHLALFRVSTDVSREVYRCAPRKEVLGYQPTVGFQDAYPLHILNLASVHDIAKKMIKGSPRIGARNFRPNIVITGGDAYAEDSWKTIRIGDFEYNVSCRTVRCLLPNVNPATGVRHGSEPNRTLKKFRCVDDGDPKNACLGVQVVPMAEGSKIGVDDKITILETGEHHYIKQ